MKKYLLSLCAVVLAVGFSVAAPKFAAIYFIGAANEILDQDEYSANVGDLPTECESGTDVPCLVQLPDGVTTGAELISWLETQFPSNPSAQEAYVNSHSSKRAE